MGKKSSQCYECASWFVPSSVTWQLFTACLVLVAVLLVGGVVIRAIEEPHEREATNTTAVWTYSNAVYFCTVTISSVGYGDISPQTDGGRAFVIVYSVLGFGVLAWTVGLVAHTLIRSVERNTEMVSRRTHAALTFMAMSAKKGAAVAGAGGALDAFGGVMDSATKPVREKVAMVWHKIGLQARLVSTFITFVALLLGFAGIFSAIEDWDYFRSFYYCWVTLTTIGYGDVSPKTDRGRATAIVMILLGLGVIAAVLGSIGGLISKHALHNMEKLRTQVTKVNIARFRKERQSAEKDAAKGNPSRESLTSSDLKTSSDALLSPTTELLEEFEKLLAATTKKAEAMQLADVAGNMYGTSTPDSLADATPAIGLLIGQRLAPQRALVVHCAPTPSEQLPSESAPSLPAPAFAGVWSPSWVAEHAAQVSEMLPGGLEVVGLYVARRGALTAAQREALRQCRPAGAAVVHSCAAKLEGEDGARVSLADLSSQFRVFSCSLPASQCSRVPCAPRPSGDPQAAWLAKVAKETFAKATGRLRELAWCVDGSLFDAQARVRDVPAQASWHCVEFLAPADPYDAPAANQQAAPATFRGAAVALAVAHEDAELSQAVKWLVGDAESTVAARWELAAGEQEGSKEGACSEFALAGRAVRPLACGTLLTDLLSRGETVMDCQDRALAMVGVEGQAAEWKLLELVAGASDAAVAPAARQSAAAPAARPPVCFIALAAVAAVVAVAAAVLVAM
eukprot:m51a1_g59 hypothetical protein (738) ;mRNA; r:195607-199751